MKFIENPIHSLLAWLMMLPSEPQQLPHAATETNGKHMQKILGPVATCGNNMAGEKMWETNAIKQAPLMAEGSRSLFSCSTESIFVGKVKF